MDVTAESMVMSEDTLPAGTPQTLLLYYSDHYRDVVRLSVGVCVYCSSSSVL